MLSFINCLDDILKQFSIVGSLKEQQAQQHNEHKYFPWETTREKTPQKFLNIEFDQYSVTPQQQE